MPKPTADSKPARERILEAARGQFAAHGFAGARLGAVAQDAGCTKGLVIHYFAGKQGLWDAVSAYYLGMGKTSPFLTMPERPSRDRLTQFLRRTFRFFQTHPDFNALANRLATEPDTEMPAEVLKLIQRAADAFARAQDGGLIRADVQARHAHLMTYCLISGWFSYRALFAQAWQSSADAGTRADAEDDSAFFEAMMAVLQSGLLREGPAANTPDAPTSTAAAKQPISSHNPPTT